MYMREMGSVELLTREGEIEIAKRIEDGLHHMIQAISRLPDHDREILDLADKVEKDEMRIDEVVDGLIDPNAKDELRPEEGGSRERGRGRGADRGGGGRARKTRARRSRRACSQLQGGRAGALRRASAACSRRC